MDVIIMYVLIYISQFWAITKPLRLQGSAFLSGSKYELEGDDCMSGAEIKASSGPNATLVIF